MVVHLSQTKPKARKDHDCDLCGRTIEKGTVHTAHRSICPYDGPMTYRMHFYCQSVAERDFEGGDWVCNCPLEFARVYIDQLNITNLNEKHK